MQENILDFLTSNPAKKNGFVDHNRQPQRILPNQTNSTSTSKPLVNPSNTHVHHNNVIFDSLDENMSKFFLNFHKNLKDMGTAPTGNGIGQPPQSEFTNGFNGIHHNNIYSGFANQTDRLFMLQQKQQMEEQFLNLGLKQGNV